MAAGRWGRLLPRSLWASPGQQGDAHRMPGAAQEVISKRNHLPHPTKLRLPCGILEVNAGRANRARREPLSPHLRDLPTTTEAPQQPGAKAGSWTGSAWTGLLPSPPPTPHIPFRLLQTAALQRSKQVQGPWLGETVRALLRLIPSASGQHAPFLTPACSAQHRSSAIGGN